MGSDVLAGSLAVVPGTPLRCHRRGCYPPAGLEKVQKFTMKWVSTLAA